MTKQLFALLAALALSGSALAQGKTGTVVSGDGKPVMSAGAPVTHTGLGDPGVIPATPASGPSPK